MNFCYRRNFANTQRVSATGKRKISNFVTGNSSVTGYFERHMLLPQKKLKRQFAYRNAYLFICKYIFHLLMRFSQKETRRLPPSPHKISPRRLVILLLLFLYPLFSFLADVKFFFFILTKIIKIQSYYVNEKNPKSHYLTAHRRCKNIELKSQQ